MTTSILETVEVLFSPQVKFLTENRFRFMSTAKNLRLTASKFILDDLDIMVEVYRHEGVKILW
jgi:hypothetical protein